MPKVQLAGYRRINSNSIRFGYGVFVVGLSGLVWSGWLLIEWALR